MPMLPPGGSGYSAAKHRIQKSVSQSGYRHTRIFFLPAAAATAVSFSYLRFAAEAATADPPCARPVCFLFGFHSKRAKGLSETSSTKKSACNPQRFLITAPMRGLLSPTAALPGMGRSFVLDPQGKMQTTEDQAAATVSAEPLEDLSATARGIDPLVQYVVVRQDLGNKLKWPLGAVVAQACHAAVDALGSALEANHEEARMYLNEGSNMRTVVLQVASEGELLKLRDKLIEQNIGHKLWQEEPEKIPTALASVPIRKSAGQVFRGLRLLS